MYFCPYLGKGRGRGQRSKGNCVFPVSILFTNPKGPKEHVQAQSAMRGDFEKMEETFLEKSCLAVRLKKSRKCCPLSPSNSLSPLKISGNREADVSEQESVFKAHLLEYKTQREAKQSPFIFQATHLPPLSTACLRDQEHGGLCLGWGREAGCAARIPRRAQQLPNRAIF